MLLDHIVVISGPTASGKSHCALQIAAKIGGEIVNADIGSFYTPLNRGTAKPDWQHSKIPHHLFDYISEPRNETVVAFRVRIIECCKEIWARGKTPVIVGGSTLYIKSLFYTQAEIPAPSPEIVAAVEQMNNLDLWREILLADPDRAQEVGPHDTYRLQRAVAVWRSTGQKPSQFRVEFNPIAPFYFINVALDRKLLYAKIDQRVEEMIADGWLEEVQSLKGTAWEVFLMKKRMMGYDLLLKYLDDDEASLDRTIAQIQKVTRNYAKRQITFYKKLKQELVVAARENNITGIVQECDLTFCDLALYIKQLSIDLYKNFTE